MPQETGNLQIAPLLLLPFVENCFKHGTSKFLIHPWINLKIELKGNTVIMKLMNGKEIQEAEETAKSGTWSLECKKKTWSCCIRINTNCRSVMSRKYL
jgi:sensor histidine kinase YesM